MTMLTVVTTAGPGGHPPASLMAALVALVPYLIVLPIVLFALMRLRRQRRIMERAAASLGAVSSSGTITGQQGGSLYVCAYAPGSRYSPSWLKIRIVSPASAGFEVIRETAWDAWAKGMGIAREPQLGDPSFDKDFYLMTDAPEWLSAALQPAEKRQAIRSLFARGCRSVKHDGQNLEAVWSPFQLREEFDPSVISATVSDLALLGRELPAVPQMFGRPTPPTPRLPRAIAWVVPGAMALLGLIGWGLGAIGYPPLDAAILYQRGIANGAVGCLLVLLVAVQLLKGRSRSHRELAGVVILAVAGSLLGGIGGTIFLNGWLDRAPATPHVAEVIRRYSSSRSRAVPKVYMTVASWRQRGTEVLEVSPAVYRSAHDRLTVVTKPGAFGLEYVVSIWPVEQATSRRGLPSGASAASPDRAQLEARVQKILQQDDVSRRQQVDAVFELANLDATDGHPDEAIVMYEEGLRVDSWRLDEQLKLARLLRQRGARDQAMDKAMTVAQFAEDESTIRDAEAFLGELGQSLPHADAATAPSTTARIVVVPIGEVNRRLLEEMCEALQTMLGLRYLVEARSLELGEADRGGQYEAGRLLSALQDRYGRVQDADVKGYLGVTAADLYAGNANFLFGMGEPGFGVMSYHRFLATTTQEPPNRPRLRQRAVKQAISSSFFVLGIPRCTSPVCVRAYPNSVVEHDQKSAELCDWCRQQLRQTLAREGSS